MAAKRSYLYKNISGYEQALIGFGVVPAGETIKLSEKLINPNFEEVKSKNEAGPKEPAEQEKAVK